MSYKEAIQQHDQAEALILKLQADEIAKKKAAKKHHKKMSSDEIGDEDLLNLEDFDLKSHFKMNDASDRARMPFMTRAPQDSL